MYEDRKRESHGAAFRLTGPEGVKSGGIMGTKDRITGTAINKRVSASYNRICKSETIRIMDVLRVLQAGRDAIEDNPDIRDEELDASLRRFLKTIRTK